jgi:hypothetical protein
MYQFRSLFPLQDPPHLFPSFFPLYMIPQPTTLTKPAYFTNLNLPLTMPPPASHPLPPPRSQRNLPSPSLQMQRRILLTSISRCLFEVPYLGLVPRLRTSQTLRTIPILLMQRRILLDLNANVFFRISIYNTYMCAYIYIRIYARTYMRVSLCMIYTHVIIIFVDMYIYTRIYARTYEHTCAYLNTRIYARTCEYMRVSKAVISISRCAFFVVVDIL